MRIREVLNSKTGDVVKTIGVLVKNKLMPKSTGGEYLQVAFKDSDGILEFPVFDRYDIIHEKLEEGKIYGIQGTVNVWNGNIQLKNPVFTPRNNEEVIEALGRDRFLQSYSQEDIKSAEEYVTEWIMALSPNHLEIAEAMTGLISKKGERYRKFITAPSAEKHHGAKLGGLIVHVSGVLRNVNNMIDHYINNCYGDYKTNEPILDASRLRLKAIIHDIKKTDEYEYDTVIRRTPGVIGHLIDGCSFLELVNLEIYKEEGRYPLDREELENIKYAILSHHGQYGPYQPKTLEDEILHLADMIDARFVGAIEK